MANEQSLNPKLLTLGQLAKRLNVSIHQLKYAIEQNNIEPVTRVGIIRVWSEENIPLIESALRRIAGRRNQQW